MVGVPEAVDLGPILAHGQIIRHHFLVRNATDRPVRILGVDVHSPCCSSVERAPEVIAPGEESPIEVTFRPGFRSGAKRITFDARTDARRRPVNRLALGATLHAAWEVRPLEGVPRTSVGQPGEVIWRVNCCRQGEHGRGLPATVEADGPLTASFRGEEGERIVTGGIVEATRDVVISIETGARPGVYRRPLRFHWPDGRVEEHPVSWEVTPLVRASPSGLVLGPSAAESTHTILVASEDRPIRIREVVGPWLCEAVSLPDEPARTHRIRLRVAPREATEKLPRGLSIRTDHPEHPDILIGIVTIPPDRGGGAP